MFNASSYAVPLYSSLYLWTTSSNRNTSRFSSTPKQTLFLPGASYGVTYEEVSVPPNQKTEVLSDRSYSTYSIEMLWVVENTPTARPGTTEAQSSPPIRAAQISSEAEEPGTEDHLPPGCHRISFQEDS